MVNQPSCPGPVPSPAPCRTCGTCPTCGRQTQYPYPVYPTTWSSWPMWMQHGITLCNDSSQSR